MRRYAWAGVVLWLLVAFSSAIGFVRTPPTYVATISLQVTLTPIGPQTAATQQQLASEAVALARMIASPAFLTSIRFTTAVSQQLNDGDPSLTLSPEHVGAALSGTHNGARITFIAQANSAAQATRLAQAATQTLTQGTSDLLTTLSGATMRLVPEQQARTVAPDAVTREAARKLLLARLGLASATALLLVFALGWLTSRPISQTAKESATSASVEPTVGA